jgi:hypothetical protein
MPAGSYNRFSQGSRCWKVLHRRLPLLGRLLRPCRGHHPSLLCKQEQKLTGVRIIHGAMYRMGVGSTRVTSEMLVCLALVLLYSHNSSSMVVQGTSSAQNYTQGC